MTHVLSSIAVRCTEGSVQLVDGAVLHEGRVEEEGPPEQVFINPRTERVQKFMASHL